MSILEAMNSFLRSKYKFLQDVKIWKEKEKKPNKLKHHILW